MSPPNVRCPVCGCAIRTDIPTWDEIAAVHLRFCREGLTREARALAGWAVRQ